MGNTGLYIAGIAVYFTSFLAINYRTLDVIAILDGLIVIFNIVSAMLGLNFCWGEQMMNLVQEKPEHYRMFFNTATIMIWQRLFFITFAASLFVCALLILLCTIETFPL